MLIANRLFAYKRDWEFFREQRKKRGFKAARILNKLAINHINLLKYMSDRAGKKEAAMDDLYAITSLVQFILDELNESYNKEAALAIRASLKLIMEVLPVNYDIPPEILGE
ncbi:MAG: hypothetical protein Q8N56_02360 [bacterium]|nr:hypothetical protein [bacterium]